MASALSILADMLINLCMVLIFGALLLAISLKLALICAIFFRRNVCRNKNAPRLVAPAARYTALNRNAVACLASRAETTARECPALSGV